MTDWPHPYSTAEECLELTLKKRGPLTERELREVFSRFFLSSRFPLAFQNLVGEGIIVPHEIEPGVPTGRWTLA